MSSPLPESSVNAAAEPLESIRAAIFHRIGADGVYARTGLYEAVLQGLTAYVTRQRDPRAEVMRFPPVMSRSQLEKSGYLKSFPNLLGCVCALHGSEADIRAAADSQQTGGDWTSSGRQPENGVTRTLPEPSSGRFWSFRKLNKYPILAAHR